MQACVGFDILYKHTLVLHNKFIPVLKLLPNSTVIPILDIEIIENGNISEIGMNFLVHPVPQIMTVPH